MLIVLGLIALTAGLMAVSVRKLLHEQRFRSESAAVLDVLRLAQDLMLIADSDVHVNFIKDPQTGGIQTNLQLEKPLTSNWIKEVMRPRKPLQAIQLVEFADWRLGNKQVNQVQLHFLSGGAVMSQGTLRIADSFSNPAYQTFICLPGYPKVITSAGSACDFRGEKEMEQRFTESMQREIDAHKPVP